MQSKCSVYWLMQFPIYCTAGAEYMQIAANVKTVSHKSYKLSQIVKLCCVKTYSLHFSAEREESVGGQAECCKTRR